MMEIKKIENCDYVMLPRLQHPGLKPKHVEPIGIPSDQPARWMALGVAMAIQENGTDSLDYFAMLKGWTLAREGI